MRTMLFPIVVLVLLCGCGGQGDPAVQRAAENVERATQEQALSAADSAAVAAIEKLHGHVTIENGKVVSVTRKKATDAGLVHLKGLTSLQTLSLGGPVTGAGLVHLKGLTNLQYLYLGGTQVTDAGLVHLKALTNLPRLNLTLTQVTDAGVAELQKALPNCRIHH